MTRNDKGQPEAAPPGDVVPESKAAPPMSTEKASAVPTVSPPPPSQAHAQPQQSKPPPPPPPAAAPSSIAQEPPQGVTAPPPPPHETTRGQHSNPEAPAGPTASTEGRSPRKRSVPTVEQLTPAQKKLKEAEQTYHPTSEAVLRQIERSGVFDSLRNGLFTKMREEQVGSC